jgi:hypothetical protein
LREESVRCVTVKSGHDRIPAGVLPSYHVHGVLSLEELPTLIKAGEIPERRLVFSEDEYHEEYSDPYRWSNMTQMSLLGRHVGLFVGLSLEDPNIRRLIDVTHRQYPEIINYAILCRKDRNRSTRDERIKVRRNLFEEVETGSFDGIGVRVLWVDNHEETPRLLHRICDEAAQLRVAADGSAPRS